jgi:hypothetical protein
MLESKRPSNPACPGTELKLQEREKGKYLNIS